MYICIFQLIVIPSVIIFDVVIFDKPSFSVIILTWVSLAGHLLVSLFLTWLSLIGHLLVSLFDLVIFDRQSFNVAICNLAIFDRPSFSVTIFDLFIFDGSSSNQTFQNITEWVFVLSFELQKTKNSIPLCLWSKSLKILGRAISLLHFGLQKQMSLF